MNKNISTSIFVHYLLVCEGRFIQSFFLSLPMKVNKLAVFQFQCLEATSIYVYYSLVCDGVHHCPDASEESFCSTVEQWTVDDNNLFDLWSLNDNTLFDQWSLNNNTLFDTERPWVGLPAKVDMLVLNGGYNITKMKSVTDCPQTHFLCPEGLCLPLYLRCNGVPDCLHHVDEKHCQTFSCPGHYRCWKFSVCLHLDHLCDGIPQCPLEDDELACDLHCPSLCHYQGHALVCPSPVNLSNQTNLRYLDGSNSGLLPSDLFNNTKIIYLKLSYCRITELDLPLWSNLFLLDFSSNLVQTLNVSKLFKVPNLHILKLTNNPLQYIVSTYFDKSSKITLLDLSLTFIERLNRRDLQYFSNVKSLNLSKSTLRTLDREVFVSLKGLEILDMSGTSLINISPDVIKFLPSLQELYSSNFKLCCKQFLPANFNVDKCYSNQGPLESCNALLKFPTYRSFLWVFVLMSVFGNIGCFIQRVFFRIHNFHSFDVFATNLCIADFLMGLYLCIIGVVDGIY